MSENKTGKYLKYAIGEVVLVVIGILIALQINNWNENRKQHSADLMFLETLKTELTLDTISLSQKISQYKNINLRLDYTWKDMVNFRLRGAYYNELNSSEVSTTNYVYDFRFIVNYYWKSKS
jgi:hypothetical protein